MQILNKMNKNTTFITEDTKISTYNDDDDADDGSDSESDSE